MLIFLYIYKSVIHIKFPLKSPDTNDLQCSYGYTFQQAAYLSICTLNIGHSAPIPNKQAKKVGVFRG